MNEQQTLNSVGFHDNHPMMNNHGKENQIKNLEAKIVSWQKRAEAKKAEADAYKNKCFLMWQSADQSYCFCLQQIAKLEKELELVKAGWGSITA